MLMAFANIGFPDTYWRNLGLEYIYMPQGAPQETRRDSGIPAERFMQRQTVANGNRRREQASEIPSPVTHAPKETPKPSRFIALPVDQWPLAWQRQLQKARQGKIVWTYWKLAEDLAAGRDAPNEAQGEERRIRSSFLKKFFQDLSQPAGTHIFWPACLPELGADPRIFWSATSHLNSLGVVILGSQAARSLLPGKKINPMDELRMAGQIVWILRDVNALASTPTWYNTALVFLRNAFQQYLRRD